MIKRVKVGWNLNLMALCSLLLVTVLFFIAGCGSAGRKATQDIAESYPEAEWAPALSAPEGRGAAKMPSEGGSLTDFSQASIQYIIRNAYLTVIVSDIEEAVKEIQEKAAALHGQVASLDLYDLTQERRAGRIALRVPADKFEDALETLKEVGKVKSTSISEEDVTLSYIDLEARIATMAAQEERLRELLNRAEKVEEILEIEKELWRVRGNLEAMMAEFRHLQQRVRYSLINISLEETDPRTAGLVEDLSILEKIGNLLVLNTNRLIKFISTVVIVALGSVPIIVPLALLYLLFRKIFLARKERKKVKGQKAQDITPEKTLEG